MVVTKMLSGILLVAAGIILLCESLFGSIAILGFGFDSASDWAFAFGLTMAFPLFLIGIFSLRAASWGLWIFFFVQWANQCLLPGKPRFVNPLDWWHGDMLVVAIVLVHASYLLLPRSIRIERTATISDAFGD